MTGTLDIDGFREHLISSGALLRPACTPSRIAAFETQQRIRLTPVLRALYASFDGLSVGHGDDLLRIWSLDEIAAERDYRTQLGGPYLRPIADIWISADFLVTSLDDAKAPLVLHSSMERIAPNFEQFLLRYATGQTRIYP